MSKSIESRQLNQPITEPELVWCVYLITGSGGRGENHWLDPDDVASYNADPDGFAAGLYGFDTVEDYYEWVACNGAPRCSEQTKSGKLCQCPIGEGSRRPYDWLALHRSRPCPLHAKTGAAA